MKLRIQKITSLNLPAPSHATPGAAGLDLRAALHSTSFEASKNVTPASDPSGLCSLVIPPGARVLIPTGYAFEISDGYEGQIRSRSGLAKRGLVAALGTIDSDFRGELIVLLKNEGDRSLLVKRGDRIAQLIVAPVARCEIEVVASLSETTRGSGGFGSTGVN